MNTITKIIDSHQHYWQLSRGDYAWLTPDLKPLYCDFLPVDLEPSLKEFNISGTIVVQAAPTVAETQFLLNLAQNNKSILGVVGWVNMEESLSTLLQLAENPYLRGIRPMIQDISDDAWMLNQKLTPAFQALQKNNLCFDALLLPKHLPHFIRLVDRYPNLKIVIDHAAKPQIKEQLFESWATHMKILSQNSNIYCKLSGLVTEADMNLGWSQLIPYIDHIFACFGEKRIMWGSDYPVLNLSSNYTDWFLFCEKYIEKTSPQAGQAVFGQTAAEFYGVPLL